MQDDENQDAKEIQETSENTRNIDDIPILSSQQSVDFSLYESFRVKIGQVKEIDAINYYNGSVINGKPSYNKDSTESCKKIEVTTEPLPKFNENGQLTEELLSYPDEEGKEKYVTVTARFNLKKTIDDNGNEVWVIPKSSSAKLWKFMRKLGVEKLSEMIGKLVTITTEKDRDPESEKIWLRIAQ